MLNHVISCLSSKHTTRCYLHDFHLEPILFLCRARPSSRLRSTGEQRPTDWRKRKESRPTKERTNERTHFCGLWRLKAGDDLLCVTARDRPCFARRSEKDPASTALQERTKERTTPTNCLREIYPEKFRLLFDVDAREMGTLVYDAQKRLKNVPKAEEFLSRPSAQFFNVWKSLVIV